MKFNYNFILLVCLRIAHFFLKMTHNDDGSYPMDYRAIIYHIPSVNKIKVYICLNTLYDKFDRLMYKLSRDLYIKKSKNVYVVIQINDYENLEFEDLTRINFITNTINIIWKNLKDNNIDGDLDVITEWVNKNYDAIFK